MTKSDTNSPTVQIGISIIARHQLVRECLTCLIDGTKDLKASTNLGFNDSEELNKIKGSNIAVIYFQPDDPVEIIKDVLNVSPHIKVVAITDGEALDCSTQALKLGAVGIVRSDQSSKLLIEAIRRAFKGETWLNQALLTNLLLNGDASKGKPSNNGKLGPAPETITPREVEVISMIGKGLKSKIIAERLSISEATVRHHLSSIYGKLGVDDRLNLVIYAFAKGLISLNDNTGDD